MNEHDENDLTGDGAPIPPPPGAAHADETAPPLLSRDAPTFAQSYGRADLAKDKTKGLISLNRLPSWPVPNGEPEPACGHGWGPCLNGLLSYGLRPGEMVGLGAAHAAAGKTAFVMQLIDGLALRNRRILNGEAGWGAPLTPVLIASEMSVAALTWRSLARWTGCDSKYFRAGRSLLESPNTRLATEAAMAWQRGDEALEEEFGAARHWMRLLSPARASLSTAKGAKVLVEDIKSLMESWREELGREHKGREIVPIVMVDPLQRYQSGDDEVADLNALARELCAATVAGDWITLLTSDTNKASAKGERNEKGSDGEEGAAVFRGSYNLMHEVTAAIYLRKAGDSTEEEQREGLRYVETVLVKARWGGGVAPWPRFRWYGATGRFWPMTAEATEQHNQQLRADAEHKAEAKKNNAKKTSTKEVDDAADRLFNR